MKRTSLWEMKERVRGTRRVVVASWWMMAAETGGRCGGGGGGATAVVLNGLASPRYRPTRAKMRRVVRRRGKPCER